MTYYTKTLKVICDNIARTDKYITNKPGVPTLSSHSESLTMTDPTYLIFSEALALAELLV